MSIILLKNYNNLEILRSHEKTSYRLVNRGQAYYGLNFFANLSDVSLYECDESYKM